MFAWPIRIRHHKKPNAKSVIPPAARDRCPNRFMCRPESAAQVAAVAGPGASDTPARSTESCQTEVMKRTLASRKAAKAAEKNTEARFAVANERTRNIAGSMTGEGCLE